ncbi:hypothetical protein [Clostridium sp. UBA1652]|uniref:hypothetical protein n=1 Tax=Clostridium sp. UBA1652 TaxID=1946348 RepID=UPI00257B1F66|nr:hypothetical protein [Clostridium sp. UBA1652]
MIKKAVNVISLTATVVSILVIIATFLTSYRYVYINEIFTGYYPLQVSITVTMIAWGFKFWMSNTGLRKYLYTFICFILSVASIFFLSNLVK